MNPVAELARSVGVNLTPPFERYRPGRDRWGGIWTGAGTGDGACVAHVIIEQATEITIAVRIVFSRASGSLRRTFEPCVPDSRNSRTSRTAVRRLNDNLHGLPDAAEVENVRPAQKSDASTIRRSGSELDLRNASCDQILFRWQLLAPCWSADGR
jgi:hypothetical protein